MNIRRVGISAIVLPAFFSLTLGVHADCSAPPTVSIQAQLDQEGIVTGSVTYGFPDTTAPSQRSVEVGVQEPGGSGSLGGFQPGSASGTWPFTHVLSCKPSGTYVYKAKAITCGSTSLMAENTASVTLTTNPTVSIDYAGPDELGHGTVTVEYDFPNTSAHTQRSLQHQLFHPDGSSGLGPSLQPTQQKGTWTFPFSMTCYASGTYLHKIISTHCNGTVKTATDSVNVDADPEVTVSPAAMDDAGNIDVTVSFDFPNTDATTQRRVELSGENAGGSGIIASFQPDTQSGSRHFNYNATCAPPGALTFVGKAWSCGRVPPAEDRKPVTLGTAKPKINVTLRKVGFNATNGRSNIEARLDYDMGKGSANWNIGATLLSWTNADGQFYPNDTLLNEVPTTRAGVRTFTFWTPSGAQHVMVLGTATSCAGRGTHEASIDCGCEGNQQGPVGTDDPVYFADGNVRVTDVDPLPQIAGYGLVRTYNSNEQVVGLFGRGFTTLFDRRTILNSDGSEQLVAFVSETNEVVAFRGSGGTFRQTWPTARGALGTLTYDVATATYRHRTAGSSELSVFRASDGRLIAIRNIATGREAQFAYDGAGRPQSLTDSWSGIAWNLTIDTPNRRVASIAVSGHPGLVWSYNYDAAGNLLSVVAPGSATWRTYEYASNRMTASRDALNNLIESHTYDADGFGISSTGPSDEISNIAYNLPGSIASERLTRVTYKTGAIAEYALRPNGGAWRTVHASGGCASCGAHDGTFVRDELGRVVREQGADGYITVTTYTADRVLSEERFLKPTGCDPQTDSQQCRLGPDALASAELEATDATFAVAYQYTDPLWLERATVVTRPSVGVSGEQRQDNYVYHPISGAVASATVCGWKPGDLACEERTTLTTFYEGAGLAPAFDPGGVFQSQWLALPQPAHLTKSVDGPRFDVSDVSSFVYYPNDPSVPALLRGHLAATKNAAGHITRYETYDVFGNATRVVDPNGAATERTFDNLGRVLTTTIKAIPGCNTTLDALCANDITSTLAYASIAGPLLMDQRPRGGVTIFAYDSRGRLLTRSRGPSVSDHRERLEITYDPLTGKKSLERTLAYETGTWVEKHRQSFSYDIHARLQTVTHADNAAVHYTYDAEDHVATVRDENHALANTAYSYDPAGRLQRVTQTLAGAPLNAIHTSYAYDTNGNLIEVTDPNGNVTSYEFDDFGQMASQQSPVTGTTEYVYDPSGNLTQMTDANEATTTRVYDALSRVTSATSTRGLETETVTWSYDDATAGRFAIGRLSSMTDPSGSTAYHYERRGMLRQETKSILGNPYVQSYAYDADGNRTSIGYPSGRVVTYAFDDSGRPLSATGTIGGQNTSYVTAATYLPFGPMTSMTLGNGAIETRTYNARYLPLSIQLTHAAAIPAHYTYTTDPAGNITGITDALQAGYNRTFGYDDLHRLTTAHSGNALWGTGSFTWDRMGNMLTGTLGAAQRTFTHQGTTPRINTATGLTTNMTYDAAGNELKSPAGEPGAGDAAIYSPRNLLQSQFVRAYDRCFEELGSACLQPDPVEEWRTTVYDGRGLRVLSTKIIIAQNISIGDPEPQPDIYFYTPELSMLNLVSTTTGRAADVIWFASHPVADHGSNTPRYTLTDHLGTPILQTTSTGDVVWRAEYEPFGNVYALRVGTDADDQPLRFPGQQVAYRTSEGEENYNIFRWYRSGWGRYTQGDPIGVGGLGVFAHGRMTLYEVPRIQNSQDHDNAMKEWGVGVYSYAADNPIVVSDPAGLKALRCRVFTLISSPSQKLLGKCVMLGECESIFNPYDKYVTFGTVYIPSCFSCPKKCTFEAHGDGSVWMDPSTNEWDCTPWTPIYRSKEGPLDGQL